MGLRPGRNKTSQNLIGFLTINGHFMSSKSRKLDLPFSLPGLPIQRHGSNLPYIFPTLSAVPTQRISRNAFPQTSKSPTLVLITESLRGANRHVPPDYSYLLIPSYYLPTTIHAPHPT
jgi:hypothetical protein